MKKVLQELKEQIQNKINCPELSDFDIGKNKGAFDVGKNEGLWDCIHIIDVKVKEVENQEATLRGMTELMYLSKINDLLVVAEERQKRIEGWVIDLNRKFGNENLALKKGVDY